MEDLMGGFGVEFEIFILLKMLAPEWMPLIIPVKLKR
jgi:hypothetical protein